MSIGLWVVYLFQAFLNIGLSVFNYYHGPLFTFFHDYVIPTFESFDGSLFMFGQIVTNVFCWLLLQLATSLFCLCKSLELDCP